MACMLPSVSPYDSQKDSSPSELSGLILRDIAILSLRYPISRDTFSGNLALPHNGAIPLLGT